MRKEASMRSRFKVTTRRLASYLLLLMLILASGASSSARAMPSSREVEPRPLAAAGDHLVTNISLTTDTPNILAFNQHVDLTFDYSTTDAGGVLIFARPFTNGALTPNYAAHPSPLYPTSATGTGTGWFTISSGAAVVDHIRIQMWNANQTTLLFETFIPVYYLFGDPANLVTTISLTPDTPNVLAFDQNVNLTFNYSTRQQGGVRIFARPFTNGALTPHYAASGSPN